MYANRVFVRFQRPVTQGDSCKYTQIYIYNDTTIRLKKFIVTEDEGILLIFLLLQMIEVYLSGNMVFLQV